MVDENNPYGHTHDDSDHGDDGKSDPVAVSQSHLLARPY